MSQPNAKRKKHHLLQGQETAMWLLWLGVAMVVALLCVTVVTPVRYNLHVGDIAKKTITASKDIVDEMTTKQRQEAAAAQVHVVSYKDEAVAGEVMDALAQALNELRAASAFGQDIRRQREELLRAGTPTPAPATDADDGESDSLYTELDLQSAADLLPSVEMTDEQLGVLLDTPVDELENLCQNLTASVRTTLASTILEGEVGDAISNIQRLVAYNTSANLWWNVALPTLRAVLRPNMIIDQESTEASREKARGEIEPTVYKQGENIVVAGERVTASQLAVLHALGLIQGTRYDTELYIGVGLLVLLLMGGLHLYLFIYMPDALAKASRQVLLLLILVLTLALCIAFMQFMPQALPVALGVLLGTILLGTRVALGLNVILALLLGVLVLKGSTTNSVQALAVAAMTLLGGLVGIWSARKRAPRSRVLLSGVFIGAANAAVQFAAGLITSNDLRGVAIASAYALLAGAISAVLCVGIQPALEVLFNLVTPAKLLELSNPNHVLLRRLMIEAPGTYHHSMVVANIAEAAAEAIGANPLLARVGAYYHDIGKLKRPSYFKENQGGENPHDHTDPRVSTAILVSHVRDGVALGQRHRLPQRVLDIVAQHHGDTPVLFFYHKAQQLEGGQPIDIKDFRYEGPRPQSLEAALVMLADTVEAAVRTLQDATPEKIEQTVRRLVKGKAEDGQLNETTLTFRDIDRVCTAFLNVLSGVFHERIEYPTIEIHPVEELPKEVQAFFEEQKAEEKTQQKSQPQVQTQAQPQMQQAQQKEQT